MLFINTTVKNYSVTNDSGVNLLIQQKPPPNALEFFGCDTLILLRQSQTSKTALTEILPAISWNPLAAAIVAMGGTVSSEHGIGKIKTALLCELYTKEQLATMLEIKKRFDPELVLNRGNLFPKRVL